MNRIKVLQISHSYDPPFLDVANFYSELFDPKKYEVTSLFLKGKPLEDHQQKVAGEKVIFLNTPTKKMRGLKLKLIKEISTLIAEEQFQIVIAQRYKAIYIVGMTQLRAPADFKFIGVVHAYNVFKNFSRKLMARVFNKKLILLGVSDAIRDDIKSHLKSSNFNNVYSLPNCIPVKELQQKQFSKKDAREKLSIPEDVYVFGSAGRLHPEKDQETMIKAFSKIHSDLPDARLYIMGEGRLKATLEKLIDELDLKEKVKLLGMIPEGPRYFKAFDAFVLPSMREPFGMVIIEAMAAEIPIISSKSGGALEIVPQKELLFEIGNIDQCAALLKLLKKSDKEQIKEVTLENSNRLEKLYSVDAFKKNFWSIMTMQKIGHKI